VDRTQYRFETVRTDAKLSEVIKAVDEGQTSVAGVSADDFKAIKKMRSYVNTEGFASSAVIPSYANAKEVAKKFLLFMASDEAHQLYYDTTKTYLPFDRSGVNTGSNPTLFQTDVEKIMKNVSYMSIHDSKNPIFFMTNMTFNSNDKFMDNAIATTEAGEKMTAQQWMEWIYNNVSDNFSNYQGLANSVR
jgi:ABC-type glycerol-3-phosphate transport system substrate-binding protein